MKMAWLIGKNMTSHSYLAVKNKKAIEICQKNDEP
jgi:hypothetical protein